MKRSTLTTLLDLLLTAAIAMMITFNGVGIVPGAELFVAFKIWLGMSIYILMTAKGRERPQ